MGAGLGPPDEPHPFLDQGLPGLVGRMRLAGDDKLHRPLRVGQQPEQARPGRAAAGLAACRWRSAGRTPASAPSGSNRCSGSSTVSGAAPEAASCRARRCASVLDQRLGGWRCGTATAGRRRRGGCPAPACPAVPSQRSLPHASVQSSSAARSPRWACGPRWSRARPAPRLRASAGKRCKDAPAYLTVQSADPVDRAAAPDRQVRHVERLGRVVGVLAAQCQQLLRSVIPSLAPA